MTAIPDTLDGERSWGIEALDGIACRSTALVRAARAEATRRAYRSDWAHYEGWCWDHGLLALPAAPVTVGLYLTALEPREGMPGFSPTE